MTWYICQKEYEFDEKGQIGDYKFYPVFPLKGRVSFKDASRINEELAGIFGITMYFSDGSNNVWHSGIDD
jgi:hypothetical protein